MVECLATLTDLVVIESGLKVNLCTTTKGCLIRIQGGRIEIEILLFYQRLGEFREGFKLCGLLKIQFSYVTRSFRKWNYVTGLFFSLSFTNDTMHDTID